MWLEPLHAPLQSLFSYRDGCRSHTDYQASVHTLLFEELSLQPVLQHETLTMSNNEGVLLRIWHVLIYFISTISTWLNALKGSSSCPLFPSNHERDAAMMTLEKFLKIIEGDDVVVTTTRGWTAKKGFLIQVADSSHLFGRQNLQFSPEASSASRRLLSRV